MELFGNLPQERAMASLLHDTNRDTSNLTYHLSKLSMWFSENTKEIEAAGINTSIPHVLIQYLKSSNKSIKEDIDAYYNKFKTDFI